MIQNQQVIQQRIDYIKQCIHDLCQCNYDKNHAIPTLSTLEIYENIQQTVAEHFNTLINCIQAKLLEIVSDRKKITEDIKNQHTKLQKTVNRQNNLLFSIIKRKNQNMKPILKINQQIDHINNILKLNETKLTDIIRSLNEMIVYINSYVIDEVLWAGRELVKRVGGEDLSKVQIPRFEEQQAMKEVLDHVVNIASTQQFAA